MLQYQPLETSVEMNIIDLVKCWQVRKDGPMVVVIPKEIREKLRIVTGSKFLVSYDKKKRLIFTKVDDK